MALPIRRVLGLSTIVLVIGGAIVWSFLPKPVSVDLATVERGPFQVSVEDEGRTRVHDAYVVSAPIGGRLLRIGNRAGEDVIAGKSVVAQLQPTEPAFLDARARAQAQATIKAAEAARKSAAASVVQAQAEVDHAVPELARVERLAARDLVSKADLENAQLQERKAKAGLEAARSALSVREFELENAKMLIADFGDISNPKAIVSLKAPVTGRVFRVLQQSEAVVTAGTPILEIGNPDDLEVMVEFLSTDAVKVQPGATARITDWGGPKDLAARVRLVEPSGFTKISALGVEEQRVRVILDIAEPRTAWPQLGDGFRVNARIVVSETVDAVHAPLSALFRNGEGWQAFVVHDGRAVRTNISVGQTNDSDAQILKGLQPGDRVILHPSDKITDDVPIAVRPG
jgi:HlyD family secretion protein